MKKMKVLFIAPYPKDKAPSQRLKFEQYFDYFEQNGIEIVFSPFMSETFWKIVYKKGFFAKKVVYTLLGYVKRVLDFFRAINCAAIYIHLEAAPFGPPIFEYIFKIMKKPIIYDIDDLIYLPRKSEANNLVNRLRNRNKIPKIMRLSNIVIVVTNYLKDFTKQYNKNVIYIPPTINTEKYGKNYFRKNAKVCIGWSGSYSTTKYLLLLSNVLKKINEKYDVKIKVIGDKNFKIEGLNLDAKDWSKETEVQDLDEIDIGLYPLPQEEWVLGKGGLKALQYMGMGIPPVCTAYGAATEIIENGKTGFLVSSEEEWINTISKLIEDKKLRKKVGLEARKVVEEKYSVNANKNKMLKVFEFVKNKSSKEDKTHE